MKIEVVTGELGKLISKNLPKILMVVGGIAGVGAVASAVKATRNLDEVLDESKAELDKIEETKESEGYSEEEAKKDAAIVRGRTALKIAKLYAPAIALESASLIAFGSGFKVLNDRYLSVSAAAMMTERAFREYRSRVAERFGEEVDQQLRYKMVEKDVEQAEIDENGNETGVVKRKSAPDKDGLKMEFAFYFDGESDKYSKGGPIKSDAKANKSYLLKLEEYCNMKLYNNYRFGRGGRFTLNDLRDELGMERDPSLYTVGWTYDPNRKECREHTSINLGIFNDYNIDFINERERVALIIPNIETLNVHA